MNLSRIEKGFLTVSNTLISEVEKKYLIGRKYILISLLTVGYNDIISNIVLFYNKIT